MLPEPKHQGTSSQNKTIGITSTYIPGLASTYHTIWKHDQVFKNKILKKGLYRIYSVKTKGS